MQLPRWSLIGLYLLLVFGLIAAFGVSALPAQAEAGCTELLVNGGFEDDSGWVLGVAPLIPQYVTYAQHGGDRSLALGITKGGNQQSYSSARQAVTIPANASKVTLSFWVYAMAGGPPTTDYMELALLSADGSSILDKPWRSSNDSRTWNQMTFDLTQWRGRTLQVYFNVYNDGLGGTAGMFLDDASLIICPTATQTPSPQPPTATSVPTATATPAPPTQAPTITFTPTPSPLPTQTAVVATSTPSVVPSVTPGPSPTTGATPGGCTDLLRNGDFETDLAYWEIKPEELPVQRVNNPVHGGSWALRLGTQDHNVESYSSVRQQVTIPAGYSSVTLEFWTYTWSEPTAGNDYQEVALLAPGEAVIAKPWHTLANERAWIQHSTPLIGYAGDPIVVYFNVYNDGTGGTTAMFLDDVHLWACGTFHPPTVATVVGSANGVPAGMGTARPGFTPEVTRVALVLTPASTPTLAPLRALAIATSTPAPAPSSLLGRLWDKATGRWPASGIYAGTFLVALILMLAAWWLTSRRGDGHSQSG